MNLEYIFKPARWLHNSPRQLRTSFCYYKRVLRAPQTLSPLLLPTEHFHFPFDSSGSPANVCVYWRCWEILGGSGFAVKVFSPILQENRGRTEHTVTLLPYKGDKKLPSDLHHSQIKVKSSFLGKHPLTPIGTSNLGNCSSRVRPELFLHSRKWFLPQLGRFLGFFRVLSGWNIKHSPLLWVLPLQISTKQWHQAQGGQGKCRHCESEGKIVISRLLLQKTAIVKEGFVDELLGGF